MSIYNKFAITTNDYICPICRDPIKKEEEAVAHAGQGNLHPLHFRCAVAAYQTLPKCPTCREDVDFSFKDKCLTVLNYIAEELNYIAENGLLGLRNGSLVGCMPAGVGMFIDSCYVPTFIFLAGIIYMLASKELRSSYSISYLSVFGAGFTGGCLGIVFPQYAPLLGIPGAIVGAISGGILEKRGFVLGR